MWRGMSSLSHSGGFICLYVYMFICVDVAVCVIHMIACGIM
jgi:hypothetical protein